MYPYNIMQWLFFFYTYCFVGWCFESAYVSICKRKAINRGFMRGPFLPIYGSGAIVMLIVSAPFRENLLLTYIAGVIGATLLEYITGYCMELLFKVRYWDYSSQRFNYQGYICLSSSIAWGFLTILMTRVIHRPIEQFVLGIPSAILSIVTILLTIGIAADFAVAFRTALDLRDILMRMEKGKEELLRMQKRLDVILAVIDDSKEEIAEGLEQKKEVLTLRTEEVAKGIEDRFAKLKNVIYEKPNKYLESMRDEVAELRGRFSSHTNSETSNISKDFFKRNLIQGNPTMRSTKYNAILEEIKQEIAEKYNHKKNK